MVGSGGEGLRNLTRQNRAIVVCVVDAVWLLHVPSMQVPNSDELVSLDGDFWRFRLSEPYRRVLYRPWDIFWAHQMLGDLTEILGPEFITTILAALPTLWSRQVPVSHALTALLVERAPALARAFREVSGRGLLVKSMRELYATQGEPGAEIYTPLDHAFTEPGQRPATHPKNLRGIVRGGAPDLYNVAIGAAMENLFPLADGECESRKSIPLFQPPPPTDQESPNTPPPAPENPLEKEVRRRGESLAVVRHLAVYVKTRGA